MVTAFERAIRIKEICETLNKIKDKGRKLDVEEFVYVICARYLCSRRMAREYIEICKREVKWKDAK